MAKPKQFSINGEVFTIEPLCMDDLELFIKLENEESRVEALKEIIRTTLKRTEPTATDEELKKMNMKYGKEFIDAILIVNGIKKEDNAEHKG
jgi:hypothetical protein